jgi:hypothetical protein
VEVGIVLGSEGGHMFAAAAVALGVGFKALQ